MIDAVPPEKRLDYLDQQLNQKRQVRLRTCADVYDYWRSCKKRFYKKAPKDGVEFEIDYIDTGLALNEDIRSKAPIALALHGAPGSYHDFALLIHHLSQQNVRVIAPNFPEYVATVRTKVLFRHSADEKAAYLRDFLKAINVTTIDLLVSHSSAIFPTLLILLNGNQEAVAARQSKQQQGGNNSNGIKSIMCDNCDTTTTKNKAILDEDDNATTDSLPYDSANGSTTEELAPSEPDEAATCFEETKVGTVVAVAADNNANNVSSKAANHRTDRNNNYNCNATNGAVVVAVENDQDFEEGEKRDTDKLISNANNTANNDDNNGNTGSIRSGATAITKEAEAVHVADDNNEDNLQVVNNYSNADRKGKKSHRKSANNKTTRRNSEDVIVKFDQPIEIKAVALFNPAGHRLPKSMKPTWFKCGSVHIYQHKLGRSLFRKLGPAFLTVVGVPVKVDNMDNVMLSATVMRNSKCQRVVQQLEQLSNMKVPTLLVFSENDKLIEREIFYEMTQFMKLDPKNFDVFNNDGDIELSRKYLRLNCTSNLLSREDDDAFLKSTTMMTNKCTIPTLLSNTESLRDNWIRVMVFKAGGHYAYSNYAKTVNKAVSELLRKVVPADS